MKRCPACQGEFPVPPGGAIPYRCPHCERLVLGAYHVLEWIGGGGMGDVYRAVDPQSGRPPVAIKVPKIDVDPDQARRRFARETAASQRLQHENVVRALEHGEEEGRPYLVMELVEGRKLSEVIAEEHPLAPRRVAAILLGIARGLAHAEKMGVVHRDVKPENVLLTAGDETPKILDYGLALILDLEDDGEQVTRPGSWLGTPAYSAPEQFRDPHDVWISADVYSLGCTAYGCLTGHPPFRGSEDDRTYQELHSRSPRPGVKDTRPDVPAEFDDLIRMMMSIARRQRPAPAKVVRTLEEMADRLEDQRPVAAGEADGPRIDVQCPECGTVYHLLAGSAGRTMQCPNRLCGATFPVLQTAAPLEAMEAEVVGGEDGLPEVVEAEIAEVPSADTGERPSGTTPPTTIPERVSASVPEAVEAVPRTPVPRTPVPQDRPGEDRQAASADSGDRGSSAAAGQPSRREERKRGRPAVRRRRTRIPWAAVGVLAALLAGTFLIASRYVEWDTVLGPNPEARWAEAMQLFDEKKWDRVLRELDRFEEEFPDSPHRAEIPFFRDMCAAGHDVYSPTGNADRGLEALREVFDAHRDNPAYAAYCGRLYEALARLIMRFAGRAVAASDPGDVAQARQGHHLLATVGEAIGGEGVPEQTAGLLLPIEHAESAVRFMEAQREVMKRLEEAKSLEANVDADAVYAEIDGVLDEYATLGRELARLNTRLETADEPTRSLLGELYAYYNGSDLAGAVEQTRSLLRKATKETRAEKLAAYKVEAARIHFWPEPADARAPPNDDAQSSSGRQGSMLVVVWGDAAGEVRVWNELFKPVAPANPEAVFFALGRGILHAFDSEGALLWARRLGIDSHRLPQRIRATATSPAARIAVSTEDNTLLALEEVTGRLLWRYRVGQDIVAPLCIAQRSVAPDAPSRQCGLLPTADGEIHVLELVLGKPLGRYEVGQPMTAGSVYDERTGLVYCPADAKRVFAIDPAAVDHPNRPACRWVLLTGHAGGSLRSQPAVIGQYLVLSEASNLAQTRLRAFEIRESGLVEPTDAARKELALPGWAWFEPHCTPDRITLVTDQGELGLIGLNLDNPDEALYRIVPDWQAKAAAPFRNLVVHAEEHLLWISAGGALEQLAVDVVHQQVKRVGPRGGDAAAVRGIPVHEAQTDRLARRFYLATISPGGHGLRFTAVDSDTGRRLWQRQLGVDLLGDPLPWDDGALLIDRSGRFVVLRPGMQPVAGGERAPEGAEIDRLLRLGDGPGPGHLVVPAAGGTELAILAVDPGTRAQGSAWRVLKLPDPLDGRPCISGDFVVAPCSDGQIYRIRFQGDGRNDKRQVSFTTGSRQQVDLYSLSPEAVLLVDGRRHLRRLEVRREDVLTRWQQAGGEFKPEGEGARLEGRPVAVGNRLFVSDSQGTLTCLDARDPSRRLASWPLGGRVTGGPVLRNGRLVAVVDRRRLICIEPGAGADSKQPCWISEPFGGRIRGMPLPAGDTLLVADNSRRITGIRLADGKPAWSTRLRVRVGPSAAPVPCADGKMLVPLSDGTLMVMRVPVAQLAEARP